MREAAVLIVNTRSRRGTLLFRDARRQLIARGLKVDAALAVRHPSQLPETVRGVIDSGCRFVILGGGDGTISAMAGYFAYRDVTLGLLPLGTANRFAQTLGIPTALDEAIEVLMNGDIKPIDLGKVNDRYFVNVSTVGLTTAVALAATRELKRRLGWLTYPYLGARFILTFRPFACRIAAREKDVEIVTRHIIIANGRSYGGIPVAPDASAEDRLLRVMTMGEESRWQLVKTWLAFLVGQHRQLSESNFFETRDVMIETDPVQYVDIDGEVATRTPAHFTMAAKALKMVVPKESEKEKG